MSPDPTDSADVTSDPSAAQPNAQSTTSSKDTSADSSVRARALEPFELAPLLLGLANAAGPGLALWAWTRADRSALLLDNQLPTGGSPLVALGWAACSALVYGLVCALVWRRGSAGARAASVRRLGRLLAPLSAIMLIPLMYVPELPGARRLLVGTCAAAVAGSLGLSVYTAWPWLRARWTARPRGWLASPRVPTALLVALSVAAGARLSQLAILRHRALGSRIFDLGIFDNLMFHAAAGRWQTTSVLKGGTFTSAHCAPILQLLAPIYALAPGPSTLIVLQCVWLASGAVPVYLLTLAVLDDSAAAGLGPSGRRWLGLVFAVAWLSHPSLHGVALFDFHALTLAAPMIPWAAYALVRGRRGLWIAAIAALLLTREDLPFVVLGLALFAWSLGRRRWAVWTALAAIATLALVKLALMEHAALFMPDSETSYRYANRFNKVIPDPETGGAREILITMLSNPAFLVQHALVPGKLIHLAMLSLPTLGLALFGRKALWAASFGLVFTVLGSGANLHNPYLHYTVFLFPGFAVAAVFGLRTVGERAPDEQRARWFTSIGVAMTVCALLAGDRFGALGRSQAFRAGQAPLVHSLSDEMRARYAWVEAAVAQIPPEASVAATNALGAHASRRPHLYNYRHRQKADWLLIGFPELSAQERRALRHRERTGELERVSAWGEELLLLRTTSAR